jgi:heme A synthase
MGALAVATMIAWTAIRTVRTHGTERELVRPALVAVGLVAIQVTLGALTI